MRMRAFLTITATVTLLAAPALAQSTITTDTNTSATVRQPNGAVVPNPAQTTTGIQNGGTITTDPTVTGSVSARNETRVRQAPDTPNAFGCPQIDPLCQGRR